MTKRKRDVFTIIESINNWFECSDQPTVAATDSEGSHSRSEQRSSPESRATATDWAAATAEAVEGPLPGEEASHVALGHTGPGVRPEGEGKEAIHPAERSRVSVETVTTKEERLVTGGEPGISAEGNQPVRQQGIELTGEIEADPITFWDLCRAAGYDTW